MRRSTARAISPPFPSGCSSRCAAPNERAATARKSDRLPPPTETNSQRRVIRDTQTSRVGNREVVRVRAFVRVASNLALSTSELSANIPAFNPQQMLAAEAASPARPRPTSSPDAEIDAEVSFVTADLASVLPRAKIAAVLSIDEVLGRVREAANWTGSAPSRPIAPEMPRGTRLAYAAEGIADPYAGFEARIAPENVTLLPKTQKETTGGTAWNERTVTVRKGETVASVLRELGARPDDIKAITAVLGRPRPRRRRAREPQAARPAGADRRSQAHAADPRRDRQRQRHRGGRRLVRSRPLRAVDIRNIETEVARARQQQQQEEEEDDGRGVRLYQSIYETALRNQVPRPLIEDLIRIYSYDVDFQRRVQPGDSFEVLFAGEDESADAKSEVLFASLTTGGETQELLPLPVVRRRPRRLLRRDRQEREEVPGPQAARRRHHALRLRQPAPSAAALHQDAHRRRLGGADGHADLRVRQRRRSRRSAGKAATAATSASATPTATRPPTATCRPSPATWPKASASGRAR